MENNTKGESRGVSLRKLNLILVGIALVISVVLIIESITSIDSFSKLQERTDSYVRWNKQVYAVQSASDYLTEQVRLYVVTGSREHLDNYFTESESTKRRDRALDVLKNNLDSNAYHALEAAVASSKELMDCEYHAMWLTGISFGMEPEDESFPNAVKNIAKLFPAEASLPAEKQKQMARDLVFGDEYQTKKEEIVDNIQLAIASFSETTDDEQESAVTHLRSLLLLQTIFVGILIVIILVIVLCTTSQVITPISEAIPNVREGRPIPVRGASEYRFLAKTYNQLYEQNKEQRKQLDFKASHDELTGLYNRRGFQTVQRVVDLSTSALILIDADHFKGINDTYGHDTGDRILVRIADAITANFRTEDYVFRLGGDEFAILMLHVGPAKKPQIEEKITAINDTLKVVTDKLPYSSVSAGVAFGEVDDDIETIYKKADMTMYKVKSNGKRACAFYEGE